MKNTDEQKKILNFLSMTKSDAEAEKRTFQEFGERVIVDRELGTSLGVMGKPY